jgi:hypothetical protein
MACATRVFEGQSHEPRTKIKTTSVYSVNKIFAIDKIIYYLLSHIDVVMFTVCG